MKKLKLHILLIFFLLLQGAIAVATSSDSTRIQPRKLYFAINAQQGGLLNTHENDIIRNYYVGFDFRVGWQTDDFNRNVFDYMWRYPYYGFGYYTGNMNGIVLGNDSETGFGKPAALYAFFGSPLYRGRQLGIHYDFSLGLSYNFNAYDPEKNPYNVLVGSKNNAFINIRFDCIYSLPGHSSFGLGFSFQHFSNGSYQKPNKGINLVSANITYEFGLFKNRDKSYGVVAIDTPPRKLEWYLFWAGGVRMLDTDYDWNHPRAGKRWQSMTVSTAVLLQTSQRRKFGVGLDYFYFDWGRYVIEYRAKMEGREVTTRPWDNMSLGAYLAHEVGYKRIWLVTDLGVYLTKRVGDDPIKPLIYERIGLKFKITNRLFAAFSIKAHLAKADYTEWTIGYTLMKKTLKNK